MRELGSWRVYRGLLWYEWNKQKWIPFSFLILQGFFVLTNTVFFLPAYVMIAIFYGLYAGSYAASEGGAEEFLLSLPPKRLSVFVIRFGMGLVPLMLILPLSALLADVILPQVLKPFVEYFSKNDIPSFMKDVVLIAKIYTFAIGLYCFFFAVNCSVNMNLLLLRGTIPMIILSFSPFVLFGFLLYLDNAFSVDGLFTIPGHIILSVLSTTIGYRLFLRKEISEKGYGFTFRLLEWVGLRSKPIKGFEASKL